MSKGYTGEEMLAGCTAYTWKHWPAINTMDRDEVVGEMVLGMMEAAGKIDESKTEEEAKGFQWAYAIGRAKHHFYKRCRIAVKENLRLDYQHGEDGDCEGEGKSLTMADNIADKSLPENLSPEMTEALDSLSPEEREVIRCRFIEGKSAEETMERMGVNVRTDCSTVRMHTYRLEQAALDKMHKKLTGRVREVIHA